MKVKGSNRSFHFHPTISELGLESTISTGGASLEVLRCSGLD